VEACTNPRAGGQSGSFLVRRGQASGFDSPPHTACPARRTGDGARGTGHHQVQIHDGEGGQGALRIARSSGAGNNGRRHGWAQAGRAPGAVTGPSRPSPNDPRIKLRTGPKFREMHIPGEGATRSGAVNCRIIPDYVWCAVGNPDSFVQTDDGPKALKETTIGRRHGRGLPRPSMPAGSALCDTASDGAQPVPSPDKPRPTLRRNRR
jgi:hypothetical protein